MVDRTISHDWQEESIEAKARWFQSLSLAERMDILCWFTDLMLTANPRIMERQDAQPLTGRIRVLTPAYTQRTWGEIACVGKRVPQMREIRDNHTST